MSEGKPVRLAHRRTRIIDCLHARNLQPPHQGNGYHAILLGCQRSKNHPPQIPVWTGPDTHHSMWHAPSDQRLSVTGGDGHLPRLYPVQRVAPRSRVQAGRNIGDRWRSWKPWGIEPSRLMNAQSRRWHSCPRHTASKSVRPPASGRSTCSRASPLSNSSTKMPNANGSPRRLGTILTDYLACCGFMSTYRAFMYLPIVAGGSHTLSATMAKLLEGMEYHGITWYVRRHAGATMFMRAGATMPELLQWGCWKSLRVARKYVARLDGLPWTPSKGPWPVIIPRYVGDCR